MHHRRFWFGWALASWGLACGAGSDGGAPFPDAGGVNEGRDPTELDQMDGAGGTAADHADASEAAASNRDAAGGSASSSAGGEGRADHDGHGGAGGSNAKGGAAAASNGPGKGGAAGGSDGQAGREAAGKAGASAGGAGKGGPAGAGQAGAGGSSGKGGASGGTSGTAGAGGVAGGAAGGSGGGACDTSNPPSNVSAWIDESWNGEGKSNITGRSVWLADSAIKGKGEINLCVRWGATSVMTTAVRDAIQPAMQRWLNRWFAVLYPYDCFPYQSVTAKVTGYAVRPGQSSLLPSGTVPVYTETDAEGEPKCPDACGLFFNWEHQFPKCAAGEDGHFDYTLWLDDTFSGATAVGGDWGVRMALSTFVQSMNRPSFMVIEHEMGHGFGLSDYYTWKGSKPTGGSIMIVGSTSSEDPTTGDLWMVRRYWRETRALRYR